MIRRCWEYAIANVRGLAEVLGAITIITMVYTAVLMGRTIERMTDVLDLAKRALKAKQTLLHKCETGEWPNGVIPDDNRSPRGRP